MKNTVFISLFTALLLVLVACSKDSDGLKFEDPNKFKFADESADKGKTALENSGQQLMTHMTNMQTSAAMDVMESMNYFIESGSLFDDGFEMYFNNFTQPVEEINKAESLPGLKSTYYYETPGDVFNASTGVYQWDPAKWDWTRTGNSSKIELHFPSTPEGSTNDASAAFEYKGKAARNMPGEELPVLLAYTLKQGNTSLLSYKMTVSYNNDDMPTNIKSDVTIENYSFSTEFKYNSKEITVLYTLKEKSNILIELKANTKGDFDPEKIMDSYYFDEDPTEFINSANVSLRIVDVKFIGQANIKAIYDADDRIYNDFDAPGFDEQAAAIEMMGILNSNAKFVAVYVDNNKKFAESEFYVVEDPLWDEYYVDLQLIFADDSRGDFEAYFNSAFEDVMNEILRILEELGIDPNMFDNDDYDDDWF